MSCVCVFVCTVAANIRKPKRAQDQKMDAETHNCGSPAADLASVCGQLMVGSTQWCDSLFLRFSLRAVIRKSATLSYQLACRAETMTFNPGHHRCCYWIQFE